MKKLALILFITLGFCILAPALPAEAMYFAQGTAKEEACESLANIAPSGNCANPEGPSVDKLISTAIKWLSFIAGFIAIVMIIISGLKFVTSQGDSNSIASSKKTLVYAIVGLVVAAMAQVIARYFIGAV